MGFSTQKMVYLFNGGFMAFFIDYSWTSNGKSLDDASGWILY